MRFAFIAKHRAVWPVAWMCAALNVSRSGFHAWLTRSPSQRSRDDDAILANVRTSFVGMVLTLFVVQGLCKSSGVVSLVGEGIRGQAAECCVGSVFVVVGPPFLDPVAGIGHRQEP